MSVYVIVFNGILAQVTIWRFAPFARVFNWHVSKLCHNHPQAITYPFINEQDTRSLYFINDYLR